MSDGLPGSTPISFEVVETPPSEGTRARLGRLRTAHGVVDTPIFMPVGTNATVKALDPDDLHEVGATIILANTYHLSLRPGHERIARLGGLHRFMAWDGAILTDSGGFQVVSLGDLRSIDEDGVTFRSHLDGALLHFSPEYAIAVQEALGADIAVCLDQPVPPHASTRPQVAEATARTHRWAERCLEAHRRSDQALFGIIQGGLEEDLRRVSTGTIAGLPFDGLCIGGSMPWTPVWTCSTRSFPPGWHATARCGHRKGASTCATLASWMTRDPSRKAAPAGSVAPSREPTWPTCCVPTSCSPTASRLVTT